MVIIITIVILTNILTIIVIVTIIAHSYSLMLTLCTGLTL